MSQPTNNFPGNTGPETFSACAVIPHFNHPQRIGAVVTKLHENNLPVIIIDDGSDTMAQQVLRDLEKANSANKKALKVHYMPVNQGKGAAVLEGLKVAHSLGFTHAAQVDADGQHSMEKLPDMLAWARQKPTAFLSGKPVYDESVPKARLYGRHINHFFVAIETLSRQLEDTMCGFRIYPIEETLTISRTHAIALRMEFDTEIMVRMYWAGCPMYFFPVAVSYPEDGTSHYKQFKDNWRQTCMHTRLVLGMLIRMPRLLTRRFKEKDQHAENWATVGERGSFASMRFVVTLYRLLGKRVCSLLLGPISLYFFLTHKTARHASQKFLHRVHPHTQATARKDSWPGIWNNIRHFYAFATSLLDKVAVWSHRQKEQLPEIDNRQCLKKALDQDRGLLLISAHIGNLEFCRALATLNNRVCINALVYTRNARKFNRLMESLNTDYRFRLILIEEIGMETGIMLREIIDRGEIVVIVGDRTPASQSNHTVSVSFLDESAPFSTGPYMLAHLLECPVQLLFCAKTGQKHIIHIEDFEDRIHLPRKTRQQAIQKLAQRYADRLAHYAAQYPLQWFNFYDFWATPDTTKQANRHE